MRDEMEEILKHELREEIYGLMQKSDYTQAEMAEMLNMATRSFADLQSGKSMCGTLTAILLLMQMPSADIFLKELKEKFDLLESYEEAI